MPRWKSYTTGQKDEKNDHAWRDTPKKCCKICYTYLRKKGGRGLASCLECITSEETNVAMYVKESKGPLIIAVSQGDFIDTKNAKRKEKFKRKHQSII